MILITALVLIFSGIALLGYLLWQKFPLDGSTLTLSDLTNIAALSVALVSLYVAFETQKQSIKDSEQQRQSLEASREKLTKVADTLVQQQETLNKNLDTSKDLFALQKEQQSVLSKSLDTTKALYDLQKQERNRAEELANRRPQIRAFIGEQEVLEKTIVLTMPVKGDQNKAVIPLKIKNIGTATLMHPLIMAMVSNKNLSIQLQGATDPEEPEHYKSQLGGNEVLNMFAYQISKKRYNTYLTLKGLGALSSPSDFEVEYSLTAENLGEPFIVFIKVHFTRE